MFGRAIPLFKLMGFEVRLDASWIILAFLITWSLAVGYFPSADPGLAHEDYWWMAAIAAVALFLSIVIHEFAHSVVARNKGLPMRGITLFVFGGVAEMGGEPQSPGVEFWMAIVGPLTSVAIGVIAYLVYLATRGVWPAQVAGVIHYLGWVNLLLAAFNSIPAFPLDGGRVLRSAIWHYQRDLLRATRIASGIGSGFGVLLMALGVVELFFGGFVSAVWWFVLGIFLRGAAQQSFQQVMVQRALQNEPVSRFMNTHPVTVPPNISVEDLIQDYVYRFHHKMFPVVTDTRLAGCISTDDVKSIPREEWRQHSVQELMHPCSAENTITPETNAISALSKMSQSGRSRLLVVDHEKLLAIVALRDLLDFLSLKMDVESGGRLRLQP
jgi:Zn-dependent protease/predicted transcriptional regulator